MTAALEYSHPRVHYDTRFAKDSAKIMPGQYFISAEDMVIITVLGSCVSACIRDTTLEVGGMNHFMLPEGGGKDDPLSESARYGAYAMEVLVNELFKKGAKRHNLEAKVFGGGNVMASMTYTNIGERNADFVLKFLNAEKIKIVAQDLLDIYPRKVCYFPKSGRALVNKLKNHHNNLLLKGEMAYRSKLVTQDTAGDIELF